MARTIGSRVMVLVCTTAMVLVATGVGISQTPGTTGSVPSGGPGATQAIGVVDGPETTPAKAPSRPSRGSMSRPVMRIGMIDEQAPGGYRVLPGRPDGGSGRKWSPELVRKLMAEFEGPSVTVRNGAVSATGKVEEKSQNMGGTALQWANTETVISLNGRPRSFARVGQSTPSFSFVRPPRRSWAEDQSTASPGIVQVLFTSLGKSSGTAFTMTVVHDGASELDFNSAGFVLQPVANLTQADATRALSRMTGQRTAVTVAAYCLDMAKAAPRAGMVYRIAPANVQQRYPSFPRVMAASTILKEQGDLHPDGDPETYFHAIRQWAVWTAEQRFRDEAAFTRAFLDHSRKNLEAAGRRWTRDLEQAVREVLPNRWADIQAVLALANTEGR